MKYEEKPPAPATMCQVDQNELDEVEAVLKHVEDSIQCHVHSKGWQCSRYPGHKGPCAARKVPSIMDRVFTWWCLNVFPTRLCNHQHLLIEEEIIPGVHNW